jgi:hypothetical protein
MFKFFSTKINRPRRNSMTSFARFPVLVASAIGLVIGCSASPSLAWWDGGHMQIANVAYSSSTSRSKTRWTSCFG